MLVPSEDRAEQHSILRHGPYYRPKRYPGGKKRYKSKQACSKVKLNTSENEQYWSQAWASTRVIDAKDGSLC